MSLSHVLRIETDLHLCRVVQLIPVKGSRIERLSSLECSVLFGCLIRLQAGAIHHARTPHHESYPNLSRIIRTTSPKLELSVVWMDGKRSVYSQTRISNRRCYDRPSCRTAAEAEAKCAVVWFLFILARARRSWARDLCVQHEGSDAYFGIS